MSETEREKKRLADETKELQTKKMKLLADARREAELLDKQIRSPWKK